MSPGVGLDECLRNGMPEDALRYYMPAGDAGAAADLVERLALPAWWQGRVTTVRGWYLWLEEERCSLTNVAVLGLIVLTRAFLSFSLEIEIEGMPPWRRAAVSGAVIAARAAGKANTSSPRHLPGGTPRNQ